MKVSIHILSSLALAAVGASMASAQATAFTNDGVSVLLYNNSIGSFSATTTGAYTAAYASYASGTGTYADSAYSDGGSYITQAGLATASANGGEGASLWETQMVLAVTNNSNYAETYEAVVSTTAYALTSVNGLGNYADVFTYGWARDDTYYNSGYTAGFDQYSEAGSHTDNIFGSGNFWTAANYSNGTFTPASGFYGGTYYSFALFGYASQPDFTYFITVGAGATDTVTLTSYSYKIAFNQTTVNSGVPAPAAVGPFALGLLGAIRRRRKS